MSSLDASYVVLNNDEHPSTRNEGNPSLNSDSLTSNEDHERAAHDWTGAGVHINGAHFVDKYGRVCNLRGVNLSGNCKTPTNHSDAAFPSNSYLATFVGRPFPLDEAPIHLARLRRWGLTFVRFLVTWEALAPSSPTEFSQDYLTYIRALLSLFPQYGLTAFVSMHQDVWSRYSGGSGAPAWTLDAVGFDLESLAREENAAAWLKGVKGGGHTEEERGVWPVGYQRLAAATMATCFWAGDTFAPKLRVRAGGEEVHVQGWLQGSFLDAWAALVEAVGDLEGVCGFEMINEPHRGYIELPSLHGFDYNTDLHLREIPSSLSGMSLGAGHPARVPFYARSFPMPTTLSHYVEMDPKGRTVWREDGPTKGKCPWETHGVWGWDREKKQAVVLRESYFTKDPQSGRKINWYTDFYFPFLKAWEARIRSIPAARGKMVFLEAIPNEFCPRSWTKENQFPRMVYAPHWYDLNTLFAKAFGNVTYNVQGLSRGMSILRAIYFGQASARDNYAVQLGTILSEARKSLGEVPVIVGECGVPMDMNHKEAFATGDFTWQAKCMDAMITGLERSFLGFTLWNYNPDNDDTRGDGWCGENFSWFGNAHRKLRSLSPSSPSSAKPPFDANNTSLAQTNAALDDGGRILRAVVRPYPAKVAGVPVQWDYELNTGDAKFVWDTGALGSNNFMVAARETEVFFPCFLLEGGRRVVVEGFRGVWRYDLEKQTVFLRAEADKARENAGRQEVTIRVDPPLDALFGMPTHWRWFVVWYLSAVVVIVALGVAVVYR